MVSEVRIGVSQIVVRIAKVPGWSTVFEVMDPWTFFFFFQLISPTTPCTMEEEYCDGLRRRIRPADTVDERNVGHASSVFECKDVNVKRYIRINERRKAEMQRGACLR